ncbi:MAG: aldehyde dehydrogenase [Rhodospirillales bacterium 20-64-7]|nr:MAG: aldehyde dehydrogenase [Rhodospirillales bacterium 20-64-7]HQT76890.1 molybdopterin-dependent oxidoreductase [Rhodopila sp.]
MSISRRTLLASGAGLVVAFSLRPAGAAEQGGTPQAAAPAPLPGSLKQTPLLDAWLRVAPDGHITLLTGKAELGQGLGTALLQIAAEQLEVSPTAIELVMADTGRTPDEGFTAGSHSMQDSGTAILNAAAQVRALLVQAAADEWSLAPVTLSARDGAVHASDGRSLTYGALAAKLNLHVDAQPVSPLKDPGSYQLMGTPVPRVDIPAKVTGGPSYVQDMRLPGMLHARAVRQPGNGATLLDVDTGPIEHMPGVVKVVRQGSYLAVVTEKEWQAVKAWRALSAAAKWQDTTTYPDPATIHQTLQSLPSKDIPVLTWTGQAGAPVRTLKARYTRPYIMHGSIGPSCAVAHLSDGVMTVWTHTQGVYPLRSALAQLLRMPPDKVRCIQTPGAGCYGHNGADDVAGDAALIAQAVPGRPIRVQWMREQEHLHEPYGAAMIGEFAGALDASGNIVDWHYELWSNTHLRRPNVGGLMLQNAALPDPLPVPPPFEIPMPEGGGDRNSNPIYALPNAQVVEHFIPEMPLRVSALRSLGAYLNVFAIESFMDELAESAGVDPVEFRLRHLTDERAKAVVQTAAAKFGWADWKPTTTGEGRGFAFARYKNLGAYCAVALSVQVEHETGQIRLGRVVAAVDSGQPVNPDGIRNQIEGAIVQSASWTLYEHVRFDRQRILSTDWSGYPILRFPAAPESVAVHIMPRPGQPFLGTGEAGQGPTSAAIANALRNAAGVRLRDLPLSADRVKAAVGV